MSFFSTLNPAEFVSTIVFSLLGVALMGLSWWAITRIAPFSIIKEIEEDQNIALAILIGSVFVSLALIISAVILS
ncbi:DUF350 domain-containing protein [Pararhodobacter zhoushanensis]|uniref:DUF350 domain-containing protein n=1 Tax=Pararhodobacter zhoushanensis TaxID=2479545 RepID=A0ABT3H1W0_9RHOB|nr:DUF350 domain-containing protein [Pararhodobacter zhoushanensis]MCW1933751.1 DUF350 domain-containing protein [Pararhodobacter zhoushanensis]